MDVVLTLQPSVRFVILLLNAFVLIPTLFMCKKKRKPEVPKAAVGPTPPPAVSSAPAEPFAAKSPKADSLTARKPEMKLAKRNDEIVQHGPVSKKRGDYKTMNITSVNFDDSLTEQGTVDGASK